MGVWEDDAALDAFFDRSSVAQRWQNDALESWHVRLNPRQTSGAWHGTNPLDGIAIAAEHLPTAPAVSITRGELRWSKAPTFWLQAARPSVIDVRQVPGLLAGVALVEKPFVEVMTFTVWKSSRDVMDFARKREVHSGLIDRDKKERLFQGFFYGHFYPYASQGKWFDEDPLAGLLQDRPDVDIQGQD